MPFPGGLWWLLCCRRGFTLLRRDYGEAEREVDGEAEEEEEASFELRAQGDQVRPAPALGRARPSRRGGPVGCSGGSFRRVRASRSPGKSPAGAEVPGPRGRADPRGSRCPLVPPGAPGQTRAGASAGWCRARSRSAPPERAGAVPGARARRGERAWISPLRLLPLWRETEWRKPVLPPAGLRVRRLIARGAGAASRLSRSPAPRAAGPSPSPDSGDAGGGGCLVPLAVAPLPCPLRELQHGPGCAGLGAALRCRSFSSRASFPAVGRWEVGTVTGLELGPLGTVRYAKGTTA